MTTLAYYAKCEVENRCPPADEALTELERAGLITTVDVGWGHRRVALTLKGRAQLEDGL